MIIYAPHLSQPKLDMLREHKPPPNTAIRRIRISDFGLSDPKRDPDRHRNCITWSLSHALPLQKILSKSLHKFASNPTDRQTNRQTDRTKNITSFFGGGNYAYWTDSNQILLKDTDPTKKSSWVVHWESKITKFLTKFILFYPPHLTCVAALPWKT